MFFHRNDQKMTTFNYFGPRIPFVRPGRTVGNNGLKYPVYIRILNNLLYQFYNTQSAG